MAPVTSVEVSRDAPDIENLLSLNPRVKPFANAVPYVVTKKNKKHWKRNADKAENLNACGWVNYKMGLSYKSLIVSTYTGVPGLYK